MTNGRPDDDIDPVVRPQRQKRRFAQWPMAVVLGCILGSLLVVAGGRFRGGTVLLALSVLLAMAFRAALPPRRAGLLVVRSRAVDVLTLGVLGGSLLLLALVVPRPS